MLKNYRAVYRFLLAQKIHRYLEPIGNSLQNPIWGLVCKAYTENLQHATIIV